MIHDASFKLWYDHPRMVEDLLRGFVPADLVAAFDFDSLEQMPVRYVDKSLRQSRGDAAWRVRFRHAGDMMRLTPRWTPSLRRKPR